jgi:hypothetical protein
VTLLAQCAVHDAGQKLGEQRGTGVVLGRGAPGTGVAKRGQREQRRVKVQRTWGHR